VLAGERKKVNYSFPLRKKEGMREDRKDGSFGKVFTWEAYIP